MVDEDVIDLDHEILIHKRLVHSNIVGLKTVFEDKSRYYLVLDYCHGKSVSDENLLKAKSLGYRRNYREEASVFGKRNTENHGLNFCGSSLHTRPGGNSPRC